MNDLNQLIVETTINLPADLQQVVNDKNLLDKIGRIALESSLSKTQSEMLKNETYFVLLGIERIGNFEKNITDELGMGTEITKKIVKEIHEQIFKPVEITLLAIEEISKKSLREEKIKEGRMAVEETLEQVGAEPLPKENEFEAILEKEIGESPKERFGIEPAKDLGTEDFNWQGNVSGVEIENINKDTGVSSEPEETGENLDRKQILDEIEYPPTYVPESFETKRNKTVIQETEKEELASAPLYKSKDPYREPVE